MTTVQNHIHLSPNMGEVPENAPNRKWSILAGSRREIPRVFAAYDESINGSLQIHVLTNDDGPVRKKDMKLRVRITATESQTIWERRDELIDMLGTEVYFVDSPHVVDGLDHTAYVRNMVLSQIGEIPDIEPALIRFEIDIYLLDNSI